MAAEPLEIHIFADSTGESATRIARAAITQFPGREFSFVRHRRMDTHEHVYKALETLKDRPGHPTAVLYTLVDQQMVTIVEDVCRDLGIPYADLMTNTIEALEHATGDEADAVARRPVGVETDYFTRVSAIDFAVRNDDGSAPGALREADMVLVGASRSGKTPLSMYLGYLGYKTANVPLVPGIAPPEELFTVDRWRIVGLTMKAEQLQVIRNQRVRGMGGFGTRDGYADLAKIYDELDEVTATQRKLGCPVVDTTGVALEELASRILDLVVKRGERYGETLRLLPGVVCKR
ncbi:pyruvate, water dikinase regulatory protein [Demequina sp.]|uniref:pyruvate, water dikinase regulatory protein n=1 Tax=Demequina sp. TaxID=2050685 RepID=UPI0025BE1EB9|nr:pyruvate, water dikinase regulatory protein [Demequina sp.]